MLHPSFPAFTDIIPNVPHMRRSLRFFALVLTVFCLGATTALAQSVPVKTAESSPPRSVASEDGDQSSVVVNQNSSSQLTSRQDVVDAMTMQNVAPDAEQDFAAVPQTASFDFAATSSKPNMQAEGSSNRRVYYIIGGVLIAGGLAAGILALSGDDGAAGIPPPPGRP